MPFRTPAVALAAVLAVAAPAFTVVTVAVPARAQAARDASAEAFVAQAGQRALHILNAGGPVAAKKAQFRQFVDANADVPRITRFVLGKYARTVTPAQYAAFASAFRAYANSVYETRLSLYRGEGFRVTGSQARTPTDVVVSSEVTGEAGGRPDVVSWRVEKGGDGRWRVVDVNVRGVWLAITQQQDFVSTLDNNRGDIGVLIGQLRNMANAPPPAT